MENISLNHYKSCLRFYIICYVCVSLFMLILPIIDFNLWLVFLMIEGIFTIIFLIPIIIIVVCIFRSKNAINGELLIGQIKDFESTFSILPMPRIAFKVKMPNGDVITTAGVIKNNDVDKYRGKEIQLARYKKKIYCLMIV